MFEKYITDINSMQIEKTKLENYKYLDCIIAVKNDVYKMISKIKDERATISLNSKKDALDVLLLSNLEYFEETVKSIAYNSYIATNCLLRIIIENYIIINYLYKSDEDMALRYCEWDDVVKYRVIHSNKYLQKKLGKANINNIKNERDKVFKKIKNELTEYEQNNGYPLNENIVNDSYNLIAHNNYGWVGTKYNKMPNLYIIAKNSGTISNYKMFERLSSSVHNNDTFEKRVNTNRDFDYELDSVEILFNYICEFANIFIDIYSISNESAEHVSLQNNIILFEEKMIECRNIAELIKNQ